MQTVIDSVDAMGHDQLGSPVPHERKQHAMTRKPPLTVFV